jgi:hypothetical protein
VGVEGNELVLSTRRLTYDPVAAAAATRKAGHADRYAVALLSGLLPSLDVLPLQERAATGRAIPQFMIRLRRRSSKREQHRTKNDAVWSNEAS